MAEPNLAWGGFRNGQIPLANLIQYQPDKYLQADAARSLRRLATAFQSRWGEDLFVDWYQDLYRDIARQQAMWNNRGNGFPWPASVASPGNSIHGWARSADLTGYGASGSQRHQWLVANAPVYGWTWDYGRQLGEGWHFDYVGPITTTSGGDLEPIENEDDMKAIAYVFDGSGSGGSGNPLYGSTGIFADGLGFKRTSTGMGDRTAYSNWKIYLAAMGFVVSEQHNDVNVLNWAEANLPQMGSASGFTSADRAVLLDLPTTGELGQALTSTVALVNEHADDNKDAIIAAIPQGGSGGTSAYSLSIDIDSVPGTATGTATPQ